VREVPEAMRPRKVAIGGSQPDKAAIGGGDRNTVETTAREPAEA